MNTPEKEICNECGEPVAMGSGRFVNRVADGNSIEERREMGKPFPEGGWVCAECDSAIRDHETMTCPFCQSSKVEQFQTGHVELGKWDGNSFEGEGAVAVYQCENNHEFLVWL